MEKDTGKKKKLVRVNLNEIVSIIDRESYSLDITENDRRTMLFLVGYIQGMRGDKESRDTNLASAIELVRRIKLKHAKTPTGSRN